MNGPINALRFGFLWPIILVGGWGWLDKNDAWGWFWAAVALGVVAFFAYGIHHAMHMMANEDSEQAAFRRRNEDRIKREIADTALRNFSPPQ